MNSDAMFEVYDRIENGDINYIKNIIKKHPELLEPPTTKFILWNGLLHHAAEYDQLDICKLLVSEGINVNAVTIGNGYDTPLSEAATKGHLEVAQWLVSAGAYVDGWPMCITTPLISAITFSHYEMTKFLLENGSDVNRMHTRYNRTPLDIANMWETDEDTKYIALDNDAIQDNKSIKLLLKEYGGISINDVDEEIDDGIAIVNHFHNNLGFVLPSILSPKSIEESVQLRISLVDGKTYFKSLFTVGLFKCNPKIEFELTIPGDWPLYQKNLTIDNPFSFPVNFLNTLIESALKPEFFITEGTLIEKQDPLYSSLPWPVSIDAFLVINKSWKKDYNESTIIHEDTVIIYSLIPIKYTQKGKPQNEILKDLITRKKMANIKSILISKPSNYISKDI